MTRTSLLFIGYSLADWDFRVIFPRLSESRRAEPTESQHHRAISAWQQIFIAGASPKLFGPILSTR